MNKHNEILHTINKNLTIVDRFAGGMSNYTYLVEDNETNEKFVFRVPGEGGENFVDYKVEAQNMELIDHLNINSHTVYTKPEEGLKLAKYIPGVNVDANVDLDSVSSLLKKVHNSGIEFVETYKHLERLEKYEGLHNNKDTEYPELKAKFMPIFEEYLQEHIKYPCHCDAQVANILHGEDNEMYLLDWEFAGTNDFIYDIASFGNTDFTMAVALLENYIENTTDNDYIRLYAWRMFQCLQWFNVASFKEEIGLSKSLGIDFAKVADHYLLLANTMYGNIKKHIQ